MYANVATTLPIVSPDCTVPMGWMPLDKTKILTHLTRWMPDKAVTILLPRCSSPLDFALLENLPAVNESPCLGSSFRCSNLQESMLWCPQETRDMQIHFPLKLEPAGPGGHCWVTADVSTREAAPAGHCCSPRGWNHYLLPGWDKNNGSLFTVAWNPPPNSFITSCCTGANHTTPKSVF